MADTALTSNDAPAPPEIAPPMGVAVRRGMAWQVLVGGATRLLGFVAQVVFAILLSKDDFGLFAVALSFSVITEVLRDGGLRQVLIQRLGEYPALSGPVFWLGLTMNLAAAAILAALAPVAAAAYGSPLLPMLLVIALAVPLGTPASVYYARLYGDLRFGAASSIQAASSVVRYALAIALAWAGFGALALVIPLPVMAALESLLGYLATRDAPWKRAAAVGTWRGLLAQSKWLLFGTGASALMTVGGYMFIALVVADAVVGVYYFAYQIVSQIAVTLAVTLQGVLFPALSRLRDEPARFRDGAVRSMRLMVLAAAPASLALAALYRPLELVLWGGKWAEAEPAVLAVALSSSFYVTLFVVSAVQHALGWFRAWALMALALALGQLGASVAGAAVGGTAGMIAAFVAAHLGVVSLVYGSWAMRRIGVSPGAYAGAVLPAWALAALAAGAAALARKAVPAHWHPLVTLNILGAVYGVVFLALARALIPSHLREAAALLPAPAQRVVRPFLGGRGAPAGFGVPAVPGRAP